MTVFKLPLLYLIIAPKHKSSEASNLDMLKRSWAAYVRISKNIYFGSGVTCGFRLSVEVLESIPCG